MPNFDPDPRNILGKGILEPKREAALIAEGVIFAAFVNPRQPKRGRALPPFLMTSHRPFIDVARDWILGDRDIASLCPRAPVLESVPTEFVPT